MSLVDRLLIAACSTAALFACGFAMPAHADAPLLIARDVLFGNPERVTPRLSPDGKRLAWLAPDKNNVLQVWMKTIGKDDDRILTADKKRGIRSFFWAEDDRTIVYGQDNDGDENYHLYGIDLASGNVRDYTPFQGVRATLQATDPKYPNEMLVGMNLRDRTLYDIYRIDLASGAVVLDTRNPGDVSDWTADAKFQIRAAQATTPDGGTEIRIRDNAKSPWRKWLSAPPNEILNFEGFAPDGGSAYVTSSLGRDTAALVERDLATGAEKKIAESPEVDVLDVVVDDRKHTIDAVAFAPSRVSWVVVDPVVRADYAAIAKLSDGDFRVVNRNAANDVWVVEFTRDRGSIRYYAWDRKEKQGRFLFAQRPKLENLTLSEMQPITFTARDGMKLYGYLTIPVGAAPERLPLVLLVHGGPWARDTWGYQPYVQWLANRGYAVLQINYRGSSGYGKTYINAGNRQWGLKMHDDLLDGVKWATERGIADPARVAVFGGSYGGYAALAAAAFTPNVFACNVDIVGPSNLKTLIAAIPPYWKPIRAQFDYRMGNIDDPKDADLIRNASPLYRANAISKPLLIGQGANDPRVNVRESEQIVEAIEKNQGSVTYVVYPDEGHGFARPENRIDFNARAEKFLADCLGGRHEPISSERVAGSTAVVKVVGK